MRTRIFVSENYWPLEEEKNRHISLVGLYLLVSIKGIEIEEKAKNAIGNWLKKFYLRWKKKSIFEITI